MGAHLQFTDRILIVAPGVKSFTRNEGFRWPAEPFRYGSTFAWVANSSLHTFDLKSRQERAVVLKAIVHESARVAAYDGATFISGLSAFNAATGEELGHLGERSRADWQAVVGIHDRVGYYLAEGSLCAAHLTVNGAMFQPIQAALPVGAAVTDSGLIAWDGKRWTAVPWLNEGVRATSAPASR